MINFRRYAGSVQMRLRTFADLEQLKDLPEAHWLATACPVTGLSCDPAFLKCLDIDGNGRVRVRELLAAVEWLAARLADRADCMAGSEVLRLAALADSAAPLRRSAELVLDSLKVPPEAHDRISLAQVRETKAVIARVMSNGDGIIAPPGIPDERLRALAGDILAHFPAVTDVGGEKGIDRATIKAFAEARAKAVAWLDQGLALRPWGEASLARAQAVRAAQAKVDEFFLQCRVIAAQPAAAERFGITPERLAAAVGDPAALRKAADALPIAAHDPQGGVLRWSALNRGAAFELLARLRDEVCLPVLGDGARSGLSENDWNRLLAQAAPVLAWHDESAKHPLLKLGEARLRAIAADDLAALDRLCEADLAVADTLKGIAELEKLVLCQRWLFEFASNFVCMPNLYSARRRALFEQGTLVMAGREFHLAVLVENRAAHSAVAGHASLFILYCQISGGTPARTFEVAVPVTSGTSGGLFVGKRGIFHALDGQEYDAQVVQIVTQPVSLVEALYMPFTRIGKFVVSRVEKWSSSSEKEFDKQLDDKADKAAAAAAAAASKDAKAASQGQIGPILMGGGVAFAAVGSALAYVVAELSRLGPSKIAIGLAALIGILALPSLVLAWIKIRNRNLAVLLEAGGWALNDRLRLTTTLGYLFTRRPDRPLGSTVDWADQIPFSLAMNPDASSELARQRWHRLRFFALVLVLFALASWLWVGLLDPWMAKRLAATQAESPDATAAAVK
ncbi:MAG: kinesin [Planctomycetes bacterium]|nr:kinesin [Planctomycetota bacterium]